MDAVAALLRELPPTGEEVVAWGQVTSVSPLEVRFSGDTADTEISLQNADVTFSTTDTVLLVRVGAQWVALAVLA